MTMAALHRRRGLSSGSHPSASSTSRGRSVLFALSVSLLLGLPPTSSAASAPTGSTTHLCVSKPVTIPRGGSTKTTTSSQQQQQQRHQSLWWQSLFQRPKQYRQALEEQIVWLEQQMRQVLEEKSRIEKLLEKTANGDNNSQFLASLRRSAATSKLQEQTRQLEQQVALLEEQLTDLLQGKLALQELLGEQQRHIDFLVQQCEQAHLNRQELQARYQAQIDELTQQMHQQTQDQLAALDQQLQERMALAQHQARTEVWKQGHERLVQISAELEHRYQQELEAERLATNRALERQQQKMRSLAKAMAIREKALYQQQQDELAADQERQRLVEEKLQEQKIVDEQRLEQERLAALEQEQERLAAEEAQRLERLQQAQQQQRQKKPEVKQQGPMPLQKVLGSFRKASTKKTNAPTIASPLSTSAKAAVWQRRVPWQPGLPPTDLLR